MPMPRGAKIGIVGGVFAAMLGVAGYGAYNVYTALDGGDSGAGRSPSTVNSPISSAPPSAKEVKDAADAFLTAWQSGDASKAGDLTDSPMTASEALTDYRQQAHVTSVHITPGAPTATGMQYGVDAQVSFSGLTSTWHYDSSLSVVRGTNNRPLVKWAPSVLHPDLGEGDTLVTDRAQTPDVEILDRDGKVMPAAAYPSLKSIFGQLRERYGAALHGGSPGIETYIQNSSGMQTRTVHVLRPGKAAKLRTTLDSTIQAAAEKAVQTQHSSGVTALDTRTGGVLAVAFNPPNGQDIALQGAQAPGSTFKIVTATALLNTGLTPDSPARCVNHTNYGYGKLYTNVTPDKPNATLDWDFAQSCNTGFIQLAGHLTPGSLPETGRKYYGLGGTWQIGTTTVDGSIPGGTGDEMTSEMIGQGQVLMTTLNMASVSATVRDGRFHQPTILQSTDLIKDRRTISTSPLPYRVQSGLMRMMHDTVTSGTAYVDLRGFGGTVGAKTGSAEASTGQPNGWFTAYHDHVAAAGLVLAGGHGNASAGPIVASVLRAAS